MASVRIKSRLSSVLLLLLLPGLLSPGLLSFSSMEIYAQAAAPAKPQPPATILLIRHAEKLTDGRLDLSPAGFERARLLPKVFSPAGARPDLPTPQVLFATHISEHSNRPVQTVTPWQIRRQGRSGGLAPREDSATRLRPGSDSTVHSMAGHAVRPHLANRLRQRQSNPPGSPVCHHAWRLKINLLPFSAQKSHVKSQNDLTPTNKTRSNLKLSYLQSAILNI